MSFFGVEVTPGKATPFVPPPDAARLHLSQATLGDGASKGDSVVLKAKVDGQEVYLCRLSAGLLESANLDLIFDTYVEFSVKGSVSVHLAGYFMTDFEDEPLLGEGDEEDGEEEGDEGDEDDEEDELAALRMMTGFGGEEDDDDEDDEDDEENDDDYFNFQSESDEEDDEPPKKKKKSGVVIEELHEADVEPKKTHDKKKEVKKEVTDKGKKVDAKKDEVKKVEVKKEDKKAKSKDAKAAPTTQGANPSPSSAAGIKKVTGNVKEYENGFKIEEVSLGSPHGKLAKPGKTLVVRYVGRLGASNKIFDQTKGNATFKFRCGVKEVIPGWDAGVNGMRVGDRRRLTVPPHMGYGNSGVRGAIPPNATLLFDIELVDVLEK